MGRPSFEEMGGEMETEDLELGLQLRQAVALENIDKSLRTLIDILRKKK